MKFLEDRKFSDPATVVKSAFHSDRLARDRNVLAKPDPAKIVEWDGWKELGWEPDAAKYSLTPPKLPNNAPADAAALDAFTKAAHSLRIPAKQAEALYQGMTDFIMQRLDGMAKDGASKTQALDTSLRDKWGVDYDANTELAKRAARTFGIGADATSELEALVGSPRIVEMFHTIGSKLGEASLVTSDGTGTGVAMTPSQAAAERRRLEADPEWMAIFRDQRNPRRSDYVAQRQRLIDLEAKGTR